MKVSGLRASVIVSYPKWAMAELSDEALFVISTGYIFPVPQAARMRSPPVSRRSGETRDLRSRVLYIRNYHKRGLPVLTRTIS